MNFIYIALTVLIFKLTIVELQSKKYHTKLFYVNFINDNFSAVIFSVKKSMSIYTLFQKIRKFNIGLNTVFKEIINV